MGGALKKRVFIMTDGGYLVVGPDETPERYAYNKLRAIGVSALIYVSLIAWCIVPWMRENCFGPDAPAWTWDLVKRRTSCWIMGIGCFITVSTVLGGWQVYVDVVMLLLGSGDLALRNSVEGMAWVLLPIGIGLVLLGKYWQGKSETGENESSAGPMP